MNVGSVVLDTSVLISAILFGGKPRDLLQLIIQGQIDAFISPALEKEFRDVLSRPKFKLTIEECFLIYKEIETLMVMVFPKTSVKVIRSDPDDNAVLEPQQRAHFPWVLPCGSASHAAGLASESKLDRIPYGRRFLAACCGILQCALEADVDYIVTGDPHLLDLAEFKGIKIVTPSEFLQN